MLLTPQAQGGLTSTSSNFRRSQMLAIYIGGKGATEYWNFLSISPPFTNFDVCGPLICWALVSCLIPYGKKPLSGFIHDWILFKAVYTLGYNFEPAEFWQVDWRTSNRIFNAVYDRMTCIPNLPQICNESLCFSIPFLFHKQDQVNCQASTKTV